MLTNRVRRIKNKKVICAMSGGIDSSVAAALLKRAGFEVIGVFMKFWSEPGKDGLAGAWNRCCSPEAEKRARTVAGHLSIPFYIFNFEEEFRKEIVDYFLTELKKGRTPNPCVVCNKEIKFGLLLKKTLALDINYVATGHYVRKQKTKNKEQRTEYRLLRAKDKEKDQSYFLWQLNQKQLSHSLFPIGDYLKTEVRNLAKKFKLPVFDVPESQEICFISTTLKDFLGRYVQLKPGKIVNAELAEASTLSGIERVNIQGKEIGQHQGLALYTIGQRKGIELSGGPYYVVDKDLRKNLLIVTRNEKDLLGKELKAKNINWISGKKPKLPLKVRAKIRYRHKAALAVIKTSSSKTVKVVFNQPQRAITPGQSVVFYLPATLRQPAKIAFLAGVEMQAGKCQELLGGGIIC